MARLCEAEEPLRTVIRHVDRYIIPDALPRLRLRHLFAQGLQLCTDFLNFYNQHSSGPGKFVLRCREAVSEGLNLASSSDSAPFPRAVSPLHLFRSAQQFYPVVGDEIPLRGPVAADRHQQNFIILDTEGPYIFSPCAGKMSPLGARRRNRDPFRFIDDLPAYTLNFCKICPPLS